MVLNFMIAGFVKSMEEVLKTNQISRIDNPIELCSKGNRAKYDSDDDDPDFFEILKLDLKKGPHKEIDGMSNTCFSYFSYAIGNDGYRDIIFKQSSGAKDYIFLLEEVDEGNSYTLYTKQKGALNHFIRNTLYSSNGIIYGFERECKAYIDSEFSAGNVSIYNNYGSMIDGLSLLQKAIETKLYNSYNIDLNEPLKMALVRAEETVFSPPHLRDMRFLYSSYVMGVFSFVEHAAVLILPFWYSIRGTFPYWDNFCNGFHPSKFDTYRDFWNSKLFWIDSFVETLCKFKRHNYKNPQGTFDFDADENLKLTKRLYDRLRVDYRNPVHHGFSTGENKTGLSMEVPSLKKIVYFNTPPLLRELDTSAYEQTKKFLILFCSLIEKHNPEIFKYISTGWHVPVDCSELGQYVINHNMDEFISEYETQIYSKKDQLVDLFVNGYGYNWESVTGRKY